MRRERDSLYHYAKRPCDPDLGGQLGRMSVLLMRHFDAVPARDLLEAVRGGLAPLPGKWQNPQEEITAVLTCIGDVLKRYPDKTVAKRFLIRQAVEGLNWQLLGCFNCERSLDGDRARRGLPPLTGIAWLALMGSWGEDRLSPTVLKVLDFLSAHRELRLSELFASPISEWGCLSKENMCEFLRVCESSDIESLQSPDNPGVLLLLKELARALLSGQRGQLDSDGFRRLLGGYMSLALWHEVLVGSLAAIKGARPWDQLTSPHLLWSRLWLVSEYGYEVLGIDRRLRVNEHFLLAGRHEVLLYQECDNYRDHLMHALRTFLTGFVLLTAEDGPLKFSVGRERGGDKRKVLRNWYLASLWHDFGYFMALYPALEQVADSFGSESIRKAITEIRQTWSKHVSAMNGIAKKACVLGGDLGERYDHGILSYFHMRRELANLDRATGDAASDPKDSACVQEYSDALHAVAIHNLTDEPVRISRNPLSATLVLCDELQDWSRPLYSRQELGRSISSLIYGGSDQRLSAREICHSARFLTLTTERDVARFSGRPTMRLIYADQRRNFYDPLVRVLGKIYNLERIEGINRIRLLIEIWIPKIRRERLVEPSISEIDILRDFVLLAERDVVAPSLYTPRKRERIDERACTYVKEGSPDGAADPALYEYDVIAINLELFKDMPRSQPLVRKAPSDFARELWDFKVDYCEQHGVPYEFLEREKHWRELIAPVPRIVR